MTVRQLLIKRLGALPVIRAYLERLQLKECVDVLAPVRDVAHLTNGEVVEALVANRLTAPRPLYDIVDWAEAWAVEETFGIRMPRRQLTKRDLDSIRAIEAVCTPLLRAAKASE